MVPGWETDAGPFSCARILAAMYPAACQRLRIGGTIGDSAITGGVVVESYGTNLLTHDSILGLPPRDLTNLVLPNVDGERPRVGSVSGPGKRWGARLGTLYMLAYSNDADGLITALNGRVEHLEDNLDTIMGWLAAPEGLITLERDFADPAVEGGFITRFLQIEPSGTPAEVQRGPVFGSTVASWTIAVPFRAPYPFWQEVELQAVPVAGSTPIVRTGTAPIANGLLDFTADGFMQHNQYGARVDVEGVAGTRRVDCGNRTVTEGGSPAKATFTRAYWFRLPGTVGGVSPAITLSGSGTFRYREAWF